MKHLLLTVCFLSPSLYAHEGHSHRPAVATDSVNESSATGVELEEDGLFSELASQLKFSSATVRIFWSRLPSSSKQERLRIEVRDEGTQELLSQGEKILLGYRSVGSKRFQFASVLPLLDQAGYVVDGKYEVSPLALNDAGEWEIAVFLQRPGRMPEMKSFLWEIEE